MSDEIYLRSYNNFDQLFLIVNGIFVLLMQLGFALLECGSVRTKNATNILFKNLLDIFFTGISFWLVGYALAFGDGNFFLGTRYFAGINLPNSHLAHWFFQFGFASTAATIVSGSLAERCDTVAYFIYSAVISGFIYPVVAHWVWNEKGWLYHNGIHDYAGSGVVHLTGGMCALVGTWFLGPRIGRFQGPKKKPQEISGHSIPLSITGGMILTVGFLAFNGGSQRSISKFGDGDIVSLAVCNTIISASFGGVVSMILVRVGLFKMPKFLSIIHTMNGALTGMVSVCAGADALEMWGAAVTGGVAGLVYILACCLVLEQKVDDPLNAVAVHLGGGIWGLFASPILRSTDGIFTAWNSAAVNELLWNFVGLVSILTWSGILSAVMFGLLKVFGIFRVDPVVELVGLDLEVHNEPAYPVESWFDEPSEEEIREAQLAKEKRRRSTNVKKQRIHPELLFKSQQQMDRKMCKVTPPAKVIN